MLKPLSIAPRQAGRHQEIEPAKPTSNLKLCSPAQMVAGRAVDALIDFVPLPDVGEPKRFIAALVAIFSEYAEPVIERAVDPVKGIPARLKVLRLASVREILDEINAPFQREMQRAAARKAAELALPPPSRKRTPEEQARIDKQVANARRDLGIPVGGLRRR